jgi:diaminohydroxyphosphoribosylaminopyrimidine deaminase/5-amino-6-(5-phosphoribosylamino)uracil reductase
LGLESALVQTVAQAPVWLVTTQPQSAKARALGERGVRIVAAAQHEGMIALPELMDDLAALGITSVLAEGGAQLARSLLAEGLVRRLALFQGSVSLGDDAVAAPILPGSVPAKFASIRTDTLGKDTLHLFEAA